MNISKIQFGSYTSSSTISAGNNTSITLLYYDTESELPDYVFALNSGSNNFLVFTVDSVYMSSTEKYLIILHVYNTTSYSITLNKGIPYICIWV